MHRRLFILMISIVFLIVSCTPVSTEQAVPTETATPPATETSVPTTRPPTVEPVAPTETSPSALPTDWLSQLEVIQSGNWSRLQLLKTFPAEMPLSQSAVAISLDGKTMAVGSREGARIFFFDIASGQLSRTVSIGISDLGEYFNLVGLAYLPDGTLIANSTGPYAIYHMDTDGNILATWDGLGFALSADKRFMAHIDDTELTLVDIASNTALDGLEGVNGLDFSLSPDGIKVAVEDAGVDYIHTAVWDMQDKVVLTVLDNAAAPHYSPDGKFLAAVYYDYENDRTPLKIFNPDGGTEIISLTVSDPDDLTNRAPLWAIDGSLIATQIAKGSPVAWETTNWQLLNAAIEGELHAFSPDGRILITRTADGSILLWGVVP